MKRKIFIGSSKEGLTIARLLKVQIDNIYGDWLETNIWDEGKVFSLNKSALDSLVKAARKYDYGIMVATKDDVSKIRRMKFRVPRDNVMFELGLFLGSLGLSRAFVLLESGCKLPTDYNGITVPIFDKKEKGSFEKAVNQILAEVLLTKKSFNLKPIPSSALALGYFENFIQQVAKKALDLKLNYQLNILLPKSLNDINTERKTYEKSNPSEIVSLADDGSRPILAKIKGAESIYWDIPTTLSTLNNLIDKVVHSVEIGNNLEKSDWVGYELRNFKGTLEILIEQCKACKGNVIVIWLD